ncbi:hypothetical protein [Halomarina ordinaria]|uniref:Uncharacterized protein n=1 Tax=Halomarina ordinaria TaxID=3033939 RepID=A0ABD5UBM0_9EURY|nr:hypothetical protein [Halomarina sp. PSRA2]
MMWQDLVFLCGSVFSLFVLMPTLRDSMANVPLGTTLPSATIAAVYGTTFFTLGMTFSAAGSFLTGIMWSLIAFLRSPHPYNPRRVDDGPTSVRSAPQNAD